MSAVGGIPGFTFPELNPSDVEILQNVFVAPNATPGAFHQITLADTAGGFGVLLESVFVTMVSGASPAGRSASVIIADGDGNAVEEFWNPFVPAAALTFQWQWSTALSNAYVNTQTSAGYSPLHPIVMPPGWEAIFNYGIQAGDSAISGSIAGRKIRVGLDQQAIPVEPTPLLT